MVKSLGQPVGEYLAIKTLKGIISFVIWARCEMGSIIM